MDEKEIEKRLADIQKLLDSGTISEKITGNISRRQLHQQKIALKQLRGGQYSGLPYEKKLLDRYNSASKEYDKINGNEPGARLHDKDGNEPVAKLHDKDGNVTYWNPNNNNNDDGAYSHGNGASYHGDGVEGWLSYEEEYQNDKAKKNGTVGANETQSKKRIRPTVGSRKAPVTDVDIDNEESSFDDEIDFTEHEDAIEYLNKIDEIDKGGNTSNVSIDGGADEGGDKDKIDITKRGLALSDKDFRDEYSSDIDRINTAGMITEVGAATSNYLDNEKNKLLEFQKGVDSVGVNYTKVSAPSIYDPAKRQIDKNSAAAYKIARETGKETAIAGINANANDSELKAITAQANANAQANNQTYAINNQSVARADQLNTNIDMFNTNDKRKFEEKKALYDEAYKKSMYGFAKNVNGFAINKAKNRYLIGREKETLRLNKIATDKANMNAMVNGYK